MITEKIKNLAEELVTEAHEDKHTPTAILMLADDIHEAILMENEKEREVLNKMKTMETKSNLTYFESVIPDWKSAAKLAVMCGYAKGMKAASTLFIDGCESVFDMDDDT